MKLIRVDFTVNDVPLFTEYPCKEDKSDNENSAMAMQIFSQQVSDKKVIPVLWIDPATKQPLPTLFNSSMACIVTITKVGIYAYVDPTESK